ncbi:hypothetical protein ACNVED_07710 [Legionella sp. D16C41]|uniref:hypothetical protein n=1 Tax=Legionella sp. D16C41 TaxID=3402688 RepID=UPI003AF9175D
MQESFEIDKSSASESVLSNDKTGPKHASSSSKSIRKRPSQEILEPNSNTSSSLKKKKEEDYFFEKGGVPRLSFIVLNSEGTMVGAGRREPPNNSDKSFLLPRSTPYIGDKEFKSAYVVFNGVDKNDEKVQLVFMYGIEASGGSNHNGLGQFALSLKTMLEEKHGIKLANEYLFTGECKSTLTDDDIARSLGEFFSGITFNTKGTKTDGFRHEGNPAIETFIPKDCFRFDEGFDDYIKQNMKAPIKAQPTESSSSSQTSYGFFNKQNSSLESRIAEVKVRPSENPDIKDERVLELPPQSSQVSNLNSNPRLGIPLNNDESNNEATNKETCEEEPHEQSVNSYC